MNRHQAAQLLASAIKADPLADAYGTEELVVLSAERTDQVFGHSACPSVCWEGGPYEWAVSTSLEHTVDSDYRSGESAVIAEAYEKLSKAGYYTEALTSFALGVYEL